MKNEVILKFFKILKEALLAYAFDILGIVSGVIIAFQLNVFQLAPWTFAVYPAILSARGGSYGHDERTSQHGPEHRYDLSKVLRKHEAFLHRHRGDRGRDF